MEAKDIHEVLEQHAKMIEDLRDKVNRLLAIRENRIACIPSRRLRLLRLIYDERGNSPILRLARKIGVDKKTVRRDLALLCEMGLVSFVTFDKRVNPGRRGNRPRLTRKGRFIAERAYSLNNHFEAL